MIAPALDELADAYQGRAKIAKVNVDHNRALAAKYHVRSIPYLVVFKDGEKVGEQIGAVGRPSWPACWTRPWPDPAVPGSRCRWRARVHHECCSRRPLHAAAGDVIVSAYPARSRAAPSGRSFFQTHSQRSPPQPVLAPSSENNALVR